MGYHALATCAALLLMAGPVRAIGSLLSPGAFFTKGNQIVDSAGNRLLNDSHLAKMQDWDSLDTEHLHKECNRHVGIGATTVEDLEKN